MGWFSARLSFTTFLLFSGTAFGEGGTKLGINQIQAVGTHNSYHVEGDEQLLEVIATVDPEFASTLQYGHAPLTQQLSEFQVRQLELDVFYDPEGGDYSLRRGNILIDKNPDPGIPELKEPGLKVLHIQDIDFLTNCITFVGCLQEIKSWSKENPSHVPVMILIEAVDEPIPDPFDLGFTVPRFFDKEALDSIDAEILSVFEPSDLITPDSVRGNAESLEEVVTTKGWPSLASSQGKILFFLDNTNGAGDRYIQGHPALSGRVMFNDSPVGTPEAAILNIGNPDVGVIQELVKKGYMVRTRSDDFLIEARTGNTTRRDMAFASGAQWISTDYPVPDPRLGTNYEVKLPGGGAARCNPITASEECSISESVLSRIKPGAKSH